MAERYKFANIGISIEGEKHILEDLVRTIREAEHEGIEAGNQVSDLIYSIEVGLELNGMGRDVDDMVEEEEAPAPKGRLDRLKAYRENEVALAHTAEQKKLDKTNELIGKIQALKPRIDELLVTANACLEAGVEINAYSRSVYRDLDKYEAGTFVTNGISHRVGFVQNWPSYDKSSHVFTELGINNGGACGPYDFRTDGVNVYSVHENNKQDRVLPAINDLEHFLRDFDKFECAFYAYVDKMLEKQEREVEQKLGRIDGILSDAVARSGATGDRGQVPMSREHVLD